ncbi:MAG: Ig-like domain-containing protein, partial [Dehalococcoidia bacterium]
MKSNRFFGRFTKIGLLAFLGIFVMLAGALAATGALRASPMLIPVISIEKTFTLPDGNFPALPGDRIRYTIDITNSGNMDATNMFFQDFIDANTTLTGGSVEVTPIVRDDTFNALGNVSLDVSGSGSVLLNDGEPTTTGEVALPGTAVTEVQGSAANVGNATPTNQTGLGSVSGSVTMQNDGTFTYEPPPGFVGTDTFDYTAQDNDGQTDPGTVSIVITDMIWFIDNSSAGSDSGTLADPFTSLGSFNSAQGASSPNATDGDTIFVYEGNADYYGGIVLRDDQIFIGEGAGASIETIASLSLPTYSVALPSTGGTSPIFTTTGSDNAIELSTDNTIRGLDIGNTGGTGINGLEVGTLAVSEVGISGTGGGVDLTSTIGSPIAVTLDSLSTSDANDEGIRLSGVSGDFDVTGTTGTLAHAGIAAVDIDGNSSVDLGLTFASVASSGATNGIDIEDTTGSFTVTGTGGADSGGIVSSSGGSAVFLSDATSISLTQMDLSSSVGQDVISATNVNGFTLDSVDVLAGATGNSRAFFGSTVTDLSVVSGTILDGGGGSVSNIDAVRITNLLGASSFTDSTIRNGKDINLLIENTTSTNSPDTITLGGTMTVMNSAGGDNVQIEADSSADINLTVGSSVSISGTGQDGFQLEGDGGDFEATIDGTSISGNLGSAVNVSATGGDMDVTVQNLTGLNSGGTNVLNFINTGTGTLKADVNNNSISGTSSAFTGIRLIQEGNGTVTALVTDNTITGGLNDWGIRGQARAGSGTLNLTIGGTVGDNLGNSVTLSGNIAALEGIAIESGDSGGGDSNTVCLNMEDNSSSSATAVQEGYRLRHRTGYTFRLQDFPSGTVANWVTNTKSNTGSVQVTGTGFSNAPSNCALPLLAAGGEGPGGVDLIPLTEAELEGIAGEARTRWQAVGLSETRQARLATATFEIADLPEGISARSSQSGQVLIDPTGAGWGWYVDAKPAGDGEFRTLVPHTELLAPFGTKAYRGMDLLTVVMHELGHVIGRGDSSIQNHLMADALVTGLRRLPPGTNRAPLIPIGVVTDTGAGPVVAVTEPSVV